MRPLRGAVVAAALIAFAAARPAGPAFAEAWEVDAAASTLEFDFVANGIPDTGRFREFSGGGSFDEGAPEDAELTLAIRLNAIDLGDPFRNVFARGPDWFHTAEHPEGVFRLERLEARADGGLVANGALTLKGVTRPISAPLTLEIADGVAEARGEAAIDPLEYGIGDGPSAVFVRLEAPIVVRFDLKARVAE